MDLNSNNINFKKSLRGVLTLSNVKIKGIGNSVVDLTSTEIIFNSLETSYNIKKSLNDIEYLIYDKGNFLIEDKIHMGIKGEQFELICRDDELGFKNFYDNIVRYKEADTPKTSLLNNDTTQENSTENIEYTKQPEKESESENKMTTSEEIRNFYNLMKDGIISEEEFEQQKKELLKPKD